MLSELPDFTCLPGNGPHSNGVIAISPSLIYLEHAYDDAKYGGVSRKPYLEAIIPTVTDSSLAPPGKHVMSILVRTLATMAIPNPWSPAGLVFQGWISTA